MIILPAFARFFRSGRVIGARITYFNISIIEIKGDRVFTHGSIYLGQGILMRKIIATIAGAACLFCASAAQAGVFKLDFTVAGFGKGIFSNLSAPQDPISGSILFTAESLGAVVTSIDAIDLVNCRSRLHAA